MNSGTFTASPSQCDAGSNQQAKDGRLKNNLATNTIALQLNIWYSAAKGENLLAYDLSTGCVDIGIDLTTTGNGYPNTIQGLLDFANDVLGGVYGNRKKQYGSLPGDASAAITAVNEYWDNCVVSDPCASTMSFVTTVSSNDLPYDTNVEGEKEEMIPISARSQRDQLILYPNPAVNEIEVLLPHDTQGEFTLRIMDLRGETFVMKKLIIGKEQLLRYTIDVNLLSPGMYLMSLQNEEKSMIRKFVKTDK